MKHVSARVIVALAGALLIVAGLATTGALADGSGGIGPGEPGAGGAGADSSSGQFPVRAKVAYGDSLGAGRGHQGQDLMANCGKRVVAAQPGRVEFKDYDAGGAGNYVVVDGRGALEDTVYMHLQRPASVREGQRIRAGQPLGRVGTTGSSSACHLHFEMWSGGWQRGGKPIDPEPFLRQWDRARRAG